MRQLSHQINELAGTNATIEQQLLGIKIDIKQMTKTDDDNLDNDGRSIKQIQSQITQLQMHVAKIEKGIGLVFESIKSKKKKTGKKKRKGKKGKK